LLDLTFDEAIHAMGAHLVGKLPEKSRYFPSVSIDTRTVERDEAFFAIKGDRLDGHHFIEDALSKGASTIVASALNSLPDPWSERALLLVPDTTAALQNLSHYVRCKWGGPLIGITGSMGKTTTRVFTATLLSQRFNVLQSPANFNNQFGLPLSLLELDNKHEVAVLELGMNHPGEIRELGKICRPNAAVITNVASVHLEFFESVDEIAKAKAEILESLDEAGVFFANADDVRVQSLAGAYQGRTLSFGIEESADFKITYFMFQSPEEMDFEIKTPDQYFRATVPFVGKHLLYNIAAAVAVATAYDLSWNQIDAGLSLLRTLPKRGQLMSLGDFTVWDESYNSNPVAAACLLDTVANLTGFKRIIVTLGDMLELGPDSPFLHHELGQKVARLSPDLLLTVGEASEQIQLGAVESGMPVAGCAHFQNADEAAEFLLQNLQSEDLLILKGSRGIQLERIVETIRRARV
jgi:UDP-N-acetylmuramoyl-tripeptide--D-alanyl-D-alanine ligase